MAVTFPPIRHPCFMGIDFPDTMELLAHEVAKDGESVAETAAKVARAVGADEFYYNDIDGLSEAIGLPKERLCLASFNGHNTKLSAALPLKTREQPTP